jgi:hypothetical protein
MLIDGRQQTSATQKQNPRVVVFVQILPGLRATMRLTFTSC